jgi:alpha/beta superfamily hydrolase
VAVRANFRGVGASAGNFDDGLGESDDLLAVATAVSANYPKLPWTLLGFSFGAYVQSRVAQRLPARQLIMVAPAVSMYAMPAPAIAATLIFGEADEVIAPAALRAYAEQHAIPSQTVADCGHFFHGKLKHLQSLVEDKLCMR